MTFSAPTGWIRWSLVVFQALHALVDLGQRAEELFEIGLDDLQLFFDALDALSDLVQALAVLDQRYDCDQGGRARAVQWPVTRLGSIAASPILVDHCCQVQNLFYYT